MKRKLPIILVVLLLSLMALMLTACEKDPIVGTWISSESDEVIFSANGKASGPYEDYEFKSWSKGGENHYMVTFTYSQTSYVTVKYNSETDTLSCTQNNATWTRKK